MSKNKHKDKIRVETNLSKDLRDQLAKKLGESLVTLIEGRQLIKATM